ncbi:MULTISPECIES: P-loop NTPase fold protein [unclassified Anaeromyxobacter]|uniref:KAP family P-loop NTPase fold protein n=1 Tax=unclassified Anaeromyxobacter TaxID=2620896 RepID=UPI001F59E01D|nr:MULTISPECIES: P-loop NTPase fold protein [unclassified Anaeromyxobacter]
MWADNEALIDLLNVQHLVGAVLRVIKDDRLDPVTIGVYGDWGSGKSSVIQLVRRQISAEPDLLCVYFNGWRFEGYEDAKAALAAAILEEIEQEAKDSKGKLKTARDAVTGALQRMWARVDKLRAARQVLGVGVNAGVAAGGVALAAGALGAPITAGALGIAALASLLKDTKQLDGPAIAELMLKQQEAAAAAQREMHGSIRDFHRDFASLVKDLGIKRLVVIVDDLDRCLPASVIETLEAIRLFLAAPKTAFVIAADEALIRGAVAHRFTDVRSGRDGDGRSADSEDLGARYLEKLIQVPIRLPPLSRSDLHGFLNLLFAQRRVHDEQAFTALCERARAAAAYDAISFHSENAEQLLGEAVSEELKSDFVLAEQIAPVLALCAEGNPRQTKRFLNALVLRLDMAQERGVTLDRATAAKLLLLEYFLPELFRALARSAAAGEGRSEELAALEEQAKGKEPKREQASTSGAFAAQAGAMLAAERFQTWLRTEPMLGSADLRPYIYFANERFTLPVGMTQRLSSLGAQCLRELMSESEATQSTGAQRATALPISEATAIIGELGAKARQGREDLGARNSPLHAIVKVAQKRPDVGPDVLAVLLGMPLDMLPSSAAVLISSLAPHASLKEAAVAALTQLATQTQNKGLRAAAEERLKVVVSGQVKRPGAEK